MAVPPLTPSASDAASRPRPLRPALRSSSLRDLSFAAVTLIVIAAAYRGTMELPVLALAVAVAAATSAAMHARLALGRWRAMSLSVLCSLLLVGIGAPPRVAAAVLISAAAGAELIAGQGARAGMFQAGVWTAAFAGIASLAFTVATVSLPWSVVLRETLGVAVGAFLAPPMVLAIGPGAEWLFGHTTILTIREWLNYEHPLLRRLASAAPGTFQHSVNVGVLADAAATAIGGDALLARVGGLYHDVGKLQAPEFFSENQHGPNPHDELEPWESAAVLRAHVSDGVVLVTEHGMGQRIVAFVQEHHGTAVMPVFQKKAQALGRQSDVKETYRYAGPRPRSRETGIVMIADQIEATARAVVPEDDRACLDIVRRTLTRIRQEAQLEESGLTRRDLRAIEQACARAVQAMYHRRASYPPAGKSPRRRFGFLPRRLAHRASAS